MVEVDIPITPIRRQMLTTTPLPALPADFPFVLDFAKSLYFHREGQGLLTGMSNPNEKPGFDQNIDVDWELTHLEAAAAALASLRECRFSLSLGGFIRSYTRRPPHLRQNTN